MIFIQTLKLLYKYQISDIMSVHEAYELNET